MTAIQTRDGDTITVAHTPEETEEWVRMMIHTPTDTTKIIGDQPSVKLAFLTVEEAEELAERLRYQAAIARLCRKRTVIEGGLK